MIEAIVVGLIVIVWIIVNISLAFNRRRKPHGPTENDAGPTRTDQR